MPDQKNREKTYVGRDNNFLLSRRGVLQAAGKAAAVAAFPFMSYGGTAPISAVAAATPESDVPPAGEKTAAEFPTSEAMTRLSTYISHARDRALPDDVLEKVKWHVIDTFAAIVSGSQLAGGRAAINFIRNNGGKPVSTVVADDTLCGPIDAAMANGTMGHSDETDDVGSGPWHPGVNVVPAALALGEQFHIGGTHFLRAVALGYDIGSRVELATGVELNFKTPTNSIGGNFGATATAACVAGLTEQQTRWALSYSAQQCSGIDSFRRDPDHIEKAFMNAGMGARNGVTSALLVLAGFTAVNDIFSGPASFFEAYAATANPSLLTDKLGDQYYVLSSTMKSWPVGAPIAPPLESLRVLLKRHSIDPDQVREIVVQQTPGWITDNGGPIDVNAQHAVAIMLVDKKLTFKSIHDKARLKDPAIIRLRSITKLVSGPPPGSDGADQFPVIQVTLADGTRVTQGRVIGLGGSPSSPITVGRPVTPSTPMTNEWVVEKARSLMTPVLGAKHTLQLVDRLLNLEDTKNILELRPLLQQKYVDGAPPRLAEWPMA